VDACDVLIVGGGPAGSSCALRLRGNGLRVAVLDRARFPRHKPCAGWVTPRVLELLGLDPDEYGAGRTIQPIRRFLTGMIGDRPVETSYPGTVSWGIRRCEFDTYLIARADCPVRPGTAAASLRRRGDRWICNGTLEARVVVGAGGHFCPVARQIAPARGPADTVIALEEERLLSASGEAECLVEPDRPELYFCRDLRGYGWCIRKGAFLNVGLGRLGGREASGHATEFVSWLKSRRRIPRDFPERMRGHAYRLRGSGRSPVFADGVLLVGDAAGLAEPRSGEGIRPAVESGFLAADVILRCDGKYDAARLAPYARLLEERLGGLRTSGSAREPPGKTVAGVARLVFSNRWFARRVVLDRWFLRGAGIDAAGGKQGEDQATKRPPCRAAGRAGGSKRGSAAGPPRHRNA